MNDQATGAPSKKSRLRNGCLIGLGVFFGLAVIGTIMGPDKSHSPAAPGNTSSAVGAPSAPAYTKATAREIFDAYQDNQLAAAKLYADRPLAVTGTIQKLDEVMGSPVIQLATSNQFMPIGAYFPKDAADALAALHTGKKVTVLCDAVSEGASFVSLKGCSLEPVP